MTTTDSRETGGITAVYAVSPMGSDDDGKQLGIRLDAALHRRVAVAAKRARVGKATWIRQQIAAALDNAPPPPDLTPEARAVVDAVTRLAVLDRTAALAVVHVTCRLADDPHTSVAVAAVLEAIVARPAPPPRATRSRGPTRRRPSGEDPRRDD